MVLAVLDVPKFSIVTYYEGTTCFDLLQRGLIISPRLFPNVHFTRALELMCLLIFAFSYTRHFIHIGKVIYVYLPVFHHSFSDVALLDLPS